MTFQQPLLLLGLLVVLAMVGLYLLAQRRRRQFTLKFTDVALLASVVGKRPGWRKHLPPALFLLGAAGLVTAMAGPIVNLEVARNDASVMLVIDTSGSMGATDVAPTRLDAAKNAAHTLIDQLPGNTRVGLVSFSSGAVLAAPLTDNKQTVLDAVDALQVGGATATGDGLTAALNALAAGTKATGNSKPPAMIVLLTDGVTNRGSDPLQAAAQAKTAGVVIQSVGIGTRSGAVQVHGQEIGGVDETALTSIATTTGGKYYFAEAAGKLSQIYAALGSQFAWRLVRFDLTIPLIILGVVIVIAGSVMSLWWFRVLP
ncbi:MAG: Ca-activated chloride channel [Chloroflexota bacterium]|jgi:Ca-activated chloride channel family protein|nr:Ca-activated chloride channel [Chloroflexota bacterium]